MGAAPPLARPSVNYGKEKKKWRAFPQQIYNVFVCASPLRNRIAIQPRRKERSSAQFQQRPDQEAPMAIDRTAAQAKCHKNN